MATSIQQFLRQSKQIFHEESSTPLTIVIGNQSCDMDSMASALGWSKLFSTPEKPIIPVVNIPSADLPLRPEFDYVLGFSGASSKDLITLDDLTVDYIKKNKSRLSTIIVDHNVATGFIKEHLEDSIVGVVDHHLDEGLYPQAIPRIVTIAAACISFIINYYSQKWESEPELCKIALACLMIDTRNLTEYPKTKEHDKQAVAVLEGVLGPSFERSTFYKKLMAVYEDISGLSTLDTLRKDYKQASSKDEGWKCTLGTVVFQQSLESILEKAAKEAQSHQNSDSTKPLNKLGLHYLLQQVQKLMADKDLDIFSIQTSYQGESIAGSDEIPIQREMYNIASTPSGQRALAIFEQRFGQQMALQPWQHGLADQMTSSKGEMGLLARCYTTDGKMSRKQNLPLLVQCLEKPRGCAHGCSHDED